MPENRAFPPIVVLCLLAAGAADARPALCEDAARLAAREFAVPERLMLAITLVETARFQDGSLRPWPWAVHSAGQGHWFTSRPEAVRHVADATAGQIRNVDIGCFQINLRWHGASFTSVEQMFDPLANARHAARFLAQLYAETGDWLRAAGHYHSRTAAAAESYRSRVSAMLDQLGPVPATDALPPRRRIAAGKPLAGDPDRPILNGARGALLTDTPQRSPLAAAPRARLIGG